MYPAGADTIRKAALADSRRPPSIAPSTLTLNTNLGAYDNKLVSSSLSQLPSASTDTSSIAPTSPINSVFGRAQQPGSANSSIVGSGRHDERPSFSGSSAAAALTRPHLGIPTNLTPSFSSAGGNSARPFVTGAESNTHPSHPNSPWSVLSLHVLPVFNGTPLVQSIEDLNTLVRAHIKNAKSRSPKSYRPLLSSDLQDLISTGMLTLKAKLDSVMDETKFLPRLAEVWQFYFVTLPYLQGIFLPLALLNDTSDTNPSVQTPTMEASTDPRLLLLSAFLIHILLPMIPRILRALSDESSLPTPDQLGRLQSMCLILSTQARPSSCYVSSGREDHETQQDEHARQQVETLLRIIVKLRNGGDGKYMDMLSGASQSRSSGMGGRGDRRGYVGSKPYGRGWRASAVAPLAHHDSNASQRREVSSRQQQPTSPAPPDDSASDAEDDKYATARARDGGGRRLWDRGLDSAQSTYDELGMPMSTASTYYSTMATPANGDRMLDTTKDSTLKAR